MKVRSLCKSAIVISLYIVLTALNPIGYGAVQLRFSAILSALPFFRKEYKLPLILAVALANIFSPLGIIDVASGIVIWAAAYFVIDYLPAKVPIKIIITAIWSAAIVSGELNLMTHAPFLATFASIATSQMIVLAAGGIIIPIILRAVKKAK